MSLPLHWWWTDILTPTLGTGQNHPYTRSSVLLVLTRHSSLILNECWTCVINLSMFFLLCYDLTTILRSWALHQVLSFTIQYAWCSYMLSRLYRIVKTFRSDFLTYLLTCVLVDFVVFGWKFLAKIQKLPRFLISKSRWGKLHIEYGNVYYSQNEMEFDLSLFKYPSVF
jgi:hypothetical protein